jgi:hypothetical protein
MGYLNAERPARDVPLWSPALLSTNRGYHKIWRWVKRQRITLFRSPRVSERRCGEEVHIGCEREEEARQATRGLWSLPNAVPPWEFRGRNR